ncbi:MAG: hypothetical protein GXY58_05300 [Planctomycetaceae bacterium]|nr:hypothetical protein [Planctomycetaceae bacterium]
MATRRAYQIGLLFGTVLLLFGSVFGLFVVGAASAAEEYRIGVSKVDITPDYPIRLNGFGFRRAESEGVTQQIWAKALAIRWADDAPVLLLTIDSLGVRSTMVDEVFQRLEPKYHLPRENVVLTYSHSHTAPKVCGASDNIFSEPIPAEHQAHIDRYTMELTDALERAAIAALEEMRPGRLEWGTGQYALAANRRTEGGPVDHDLPVLVVRDADNSVRAIYTSYACHCVTLSHNQISGDWAGFAQESIERRYPGCIALFSAGAGSDSNPASGVVYDCVDVARAQGEELAAEVARVLQGSLQPISGRITARLATIQLALNTPPTREELTALAAKEGGEGYNASTQLARLDRGEQLLQAIDYPIQTVALGDRLLIVFLAGEVCVDYSLRLKKELDSSRLWINAYSNDFACYVPSERLVQEGGYGGGAETPYFALPATLQAGLEQQIIDEVHRQVGDGW